MRWLIVLIIIALLGWLSGAKDRENHKKRHIRHQHSVEKTVPVQFIQTDPRVEKLSNFFKKHNSPLENHVDSFIRTADLYHLDYRLLPAIAGVESTFCKFFIRSTNNCWGWGSGSISFDSFDHAISHIAEKLRTNYDTSSVEAIGSKYCPPTANKWSTDVKYFMNQI